MKKKLKSYDFNDLLNKKMKDPAFRKEWEAHNEEFELAKDIIRLRIKAGLTQKDLAERVHTSQPSIARLESGGYQNLSLSFLRRVGQALGVEPQVRFQKLRTAH
jgi:DNA-binding XRE family transcriptional regulator